MIEGPAVQFHLGDHLGSSNVVVDSGGALINREEFTPYGETSFGSFARKRYRFTGKERDEESGLSYHGARYYAPGKTRWVSCDPIGVAGGVNSYTYVHDNPLCLVDPLGMQDETTDSSKLDSLSHEDEVSGYWGCWGHEVINIDGGRWDAETENHSSAGNGGTFTYPDPTSNPVAPTLTRFTKYGKLVNWLDVADAMDRGDWDDAAVQIWTIDWTREDFEAVDSYRKWQARIEVAQAVIQITVSIRMITEIARAGIGLSRASRITAARGLAMGEGEATAARGALAEVTAIKPDVPTQWIVPVDRVARGGKAFAPKVNTAPGAYRGITPKMRAEAQRLGERWQGPGKYDVGHRDPLEFIPPRERVRLRSEASGPNRGEGDSIAKSGESRRKAGLYTRRK